MRSARRTASGSPVTTTSADGTTRATARTTLRTFPTPCSQTTTRIRKGKGHSTRAAYRDIPHAMKTVNVRRALCLAFTTAALTPLVASCGAAQGAMGAASDVTGGAVCAKCPDLTKVEAI